MRYWWGIGKGKWSDRKETMIDETEEGKMGREERGSERLVG